MKLNNERLCLGNGQGDGDVCGEFTYFNLFQSPCPQNCQMLLLFTFDPCSRHTVQCIQIQPEMSNVVHFNFGPCSRLIDCVV